MSETRPFRHQAFFYSDDVEYLRYLEPFIAEGIERDDEIMVSVPRARLSLLRSRFGRQGDRVQFAPMEELGRNPAWIMSEWVGLVERARRDHRGVRGVGEPIWAGRSRAELVECERHESLLNLVFGDTEDFELVCPYDTATLAPAVIAHARRTHPLVADVMSSSPSDHFVRSVPAVLDSPLPPPPDTAARRPTSTVGPWR